MTAILDVMGIRREFGGLAAVDDVSFRIDAGERVALIGPNGAGKTTLFNVLSGALRASAGTVMFLGADVTGLPPHLRARAGMGRTFQIAAVFRSMTVRENIDAARMAADLGADAADALLGEAGLSDRADTAIAALSYGDIKRVELAMAMAANPQLLLLDEPTAGTAGDERSRMIALVGDLAAHHGTTVLFVEHDMDTVFDFATRVLVMDQGCLIADGTPAAVRNDPTVQAVYLGEEAPFSA